MGWSRKRKLEQTVALLRTQYGDGILRRASELRRPHIPPHIPTGFTDLDHLTGCGGIPQRALTLLAGNTTSGKLTLAYKMLANLHHTKPNTIAAVLDLTRSSDPDYLIRCGLDLDRLLFVRPGSSRQAVDLLLDLVRGKMAAVVLVDSLPHLLGSRRDTRYFNNHLAQLQHFAIDTNCAVLCLDEPQAPWLHRLGWNRSFEVMQWAALHLELKREEWLYRGDELIGYQASARLLKSRWNWSGGTVSVEIRFDDTTPIGRSE